MALDHIILYTKLAKTKGLTIKKSVYNSNCKSEDIDKRILKDCLDKVRAAVIDGWRNGFAEITILINRARKREPEVFYKTKK